MKRPLTEDSQQIKTLRASLRTCKAENASLKRQAKRLLSDTPLRESELEVMRLQRLVLDLLDRCVEAEGQLRRQSLQEVA